MKHLHCYLLLFSLTLVGFMSCQEKDLSDDVFTDFAKQIEQELNMGNDSLFAADFDKEAFQKLMLENLQIEPLPKDKISDYMKKMPLPSQKILANIESGADFRFVRFYRDHHHQPHAIFRTYSSDGGVYLEDWTLGVKKGRPSIKDAFDIVSAVYWSQDCRFKVCNYLSIFSDEVLNLNHLINVNYLIAGGDFRRADSILQLFLPNMQDNLYANTIELNLASKVKSYEKMQALTEKFIQSFPENKRTAIFYLTQSSIRQGLVDEAIEHIQMLRELIGNDPVWYAYLAFAYKSANEYEYAVQNLDSALLDMPIVFDLYMSKLDASYAMENYEKCMEAILQTDFIFSPDSSDIAQYKKHYPKLAQTEAFKQWETQRKY